MAGGSFGFGPESRDALSSQKPFENGATVLRQFGTDRCNQRVKVGAGVGDGIGGQVYQVSERHRSGFLVKYLFYAVLLSGRVSGPKPTLGDRAGCAATGPRGMVAKTSKPKAPACPIAV